MFNQRAFSSYENGAARRAHSTLWEDFFPWEHLEGVRHLQSGPEEREEASVPGAPSCQWSLALFPPQPSITLHRTSVLRAPHRLRKGAECLPSSFRWFSAKTNAEPKKLRTKELTRLDARCHLPVVYFNHPNPKLSLWEETRDHINSTGPYKISVLWAYRINTSSSEIHSTQWVIQTQFCPLASHLSVSSRDSVLRTQLSAH